MGFVKLNKEQIGRPLSVVSYILGDLQWCPSSLNLTM